MQKAPDAKKILVVEDDPAILELMLAVLEDRDGYEVSICTNGKNVLAAAIAEKPDLILLDLWIPGADGGKVTRALKASRDTRHIPVVIISAQNNLAGVAKEIGADGFLSKPFDLDDLAGIVRKYCKKAG